MNDNDVLLSAKKKVLQEKRWRKSIVIDSFKPHIIDFTDNRSEVQAKSNLSVNAHLSFFNNSLIKNLLT